MLYRVEENGSRWVVRLEQLAKARGTSAVSVVSFYAGLRWTIFVGMMPRCAGASFLCVGLPV